MNSKRKTTRSQKNQPAKSNISWLVVLAGVVVLVAAGFAGLQFLKGNEVSAAGASADRLPEEISVADAFQKREAGAFILDVREVEEWNEYHIPEATLIPLGELADRVDELPRDQEIVVVCRSGNRSAVGRDILLKAGFTQVTSMAGGMSEWRLAGYPTVTGP